MIEHPDDVEPKTVEVIRPMVEDGAAVTPRMKAWAMVWLLEHLGLDKTKWRGHSGEALAFVREKLPL